MSTWLPPANQDDTVSAQIFDMVKDYLDEAANAANSCNGLDINSPQIPIAEFSSSIGIGLPDPVPLAPHTVPSDGRVSGAVESPAYDGTYEDIASIALQEIGTALYGDYVLPRTLPDHNVGLPNILYPEAPYLPVEDDAGLSPLDAPNIVVGEVPAFLDVPTLEYEIIDLAPVTSTPPTPPTLPELELLEQPEKFAMQVSQGLLDAIDRGLDGVEVIGFPEQQIMLDRDSRLVDHEYDKAERAIFDQYAASGFYSATGPVIAAVSELAYDASFKDREVYEKTRDDLHERALRQMREAVKAALTLEATNGAVHLNYASKLVETLKFNVAMQVEYANLLVSVFNEQMKGVRVLMASYKAYVDAVITQYNAYTRAVVSQNAVLDTNSAKVTAYGAQVGTIGVQADAYSAEIEHLTQPLTEYQIYVQGILKNVELAKTNIESFSQAVRAYGEAIDADTAKVGAYAAQVSATGSATGVYEANYDAYSDTLSAERGSNEARRSWYSSSLQALSGEIAEFQSASQAQRVYLRALTDWTQANSTIHNQYASAISAESGYITTFNQHSVSLSESQMNIDLAAEDARVRMDALEAQAIALQASIDIGLTAAGATTAAGCAQAAYSVRSISAGMRATAGMVDSGTASASTTTATSTNRSYAYRKTRSIST